MSYHICRSINIDEKAGKVWITGTDNNVFRVDPMTGRQRREFHRWEWEYGSRILRKQGRAAVEEYIALAVLDGNFKFYSGKFYLWKYWFWDRIAVDSFLREKADYRYDDEPGVNKDEWNLNVECLRKELWKEYCQKPVEPKKDYYVVLGDRYASKITPHRIYGSGVGVKTVYHAKKSDLMRRLAHFMGAWEIREVQ
jgi:hypothetical protein